MAWTWRYEDGAGAPVDGPGESFPSQSDAESWLGQRWRDVAASGATIAVLVEDERVEYRMSLLPAGD